MLPKDIVRDREKERPKARPAFETLRGVEATNERRLHELRDIAVGLVGKEPTNGLEVALEQLVPRSSIAALPPREKDLIGSNTHVQTDYATRGSDGVDFVDAHGCVGRDAKATFARQAGGTGYAARLTRQGSCIAHPVRARVTGSTDQAILGGRSRARLASAGQCDASARGVAVRTGSAIATHAARLARDGLREAAHLHVLGPVAPERLLAVGIGLAAVLERAFARSDTGPFGAEVGDVAAVAQAPVQALARLARARGAVEQAALPELIGSREQSLAGRGFVGGLARVAGQRGGDTVGAFTVEAESHVIESPVDEQLGDAIDARPFVTVVGRERVAAVARERPCARGFGDDPGLISNRDRGRIVVARGQDQ